MDSGTTTNADAGRSAHLPWWPIPFVFLAYFVLFLYFVESGQTIPAMVFGIMALPVLIAASLFSVAVLVRLAMGVYRGRLSWLGLLAWLAVGTACAVMAAQILR